MARRMAFAGNLRPGYIARIGADWVTVLSGPHPADDEGPDFRTFEFVGADGETYSRTLHRSTRIYLEV